MENAIYIKDDSRWEPLINAMGINGCCEYMYMYSMKEEEKLIHHYKNINTRKYLKLEA